MSPMSFSFLDFFFFSFGVVSTSIVIGRLSFAFPVCNQVVSVKNIECQEEKFLVL